MNSMLALDPSQRLSLAEVKAHAWYNGPVLEQEGLTKEFKIRKAKVDEELRRQKAEKDKQKELEKLAQANQYGNTAFSGVKPFRGRDLESEMTESIAKASFKSEFNLEAKRALKDFEPNTPSKVHTDLFLVINPDILLKYLVSLAQTTFNTMNVAADSYKIKGKYIGDVHQIECSIEILKKEEGVYCVEFNRKSGDSFEYLKIIDEKFRQPINSILNKVSAEKKE